MNNIPLPLFRFSTAIAPQKDRFDLYRSAMNETWEVNRREETASNFDAAITLIDFGPILVAKKAVAPHQIVRSLHRTRADGQDHYVAVMLCTGRGHGIAGEVEFVFEAGELRLFDMARSFSLTFTAAKSVALLIHRDELNAIWPAECGLQGQKLGGVTGALVRDHLITVSKAAPKLAVAEAPGVSRATIHLLAACLALTGDRRKTARVPMHAALLRLARSYVNQRLAQHNLSADEICQAIGVSRSGLYRLMEPFGGVAAFVQQRRLVHVHKLLSDPQERRKITELALSNGFVSETHFSRAFRKKFGYSPSEVRNGNSLPDNSATAKYGRVGWAYRDWLMRA